MCHTSNEFTNYILRGILSFFLKRSSFIVAGAITRPLTRLPNISQTCSTRFVSVEFSNTNFCQVFTDSPRCMWSGVILHQDKVSINKWSEWNQMVCQNFSMYYCAGSELPSMKTNSIEGAIDIYSVMTKPGVKIVLPSGECRENCTHRKKVHYPIAQDSNSDVHKQFIILLPDDVTQFLTSFNLTWCNLRRTVHLHSLAPRTSRS